MLSSEPKDLAKKLVNDYEKENCSKLEGIIVPEDFTPVINRCCENFIGYLQIPLGLTHKPLKINNDSYFIPIATTEGALVASLCRGIKIMNLSNLEGIVENIGITRSFALNLNDFNNATKLYKWLKDPVNINILKLKGDSTSNYLKIKDVTCKYIIYNRVFIKVSAYTCDAMGMNMITHACNAIAEYINESFNSKTITISANICTDKKWSAENYINGRGRKVVLNARITNKSCSEILHVNCEDLYEVYKTKIVGGSSLALGGFNCQASNYVSAIFLACGQDLGQVIESSNCTLFMEMVGKDLNVSLFMPSIIVGCVGGGTHLKPQNDFLKQFYKKDSDCFITDRNLDTGVAPNHLALCIAGTVLCGEISGLAALTNNTLMNAHLKLNRKLD